MVSLATSLLTKDLTVNHDYTIPLTVPVPAGEAMLLDLRDMGLPEPERQRVSVWMRTQLSALLEELPAGVPVVLVDRVCELLHDLDDLLEVDTLDSISS
jgi:hypothetical protein